MKKLLCLFLAVMLLTCSFVGCKKDGSGSEGDGGQTAAPILDEDIKVLEGVNYGGESITIHVRGDEEAINEIGMESYGDILSEALYNRTLLTEDRIGVDIDISVQESYTDYNKAIGNLRNSIDADTGAYDIVAGWSCRIINLAVEGYFHDLNTTAYYDSQDDWWSTSITDALTLGGKTYLNTGDIATTYMDSCMAVVVNQKVSDSFHYQYDAFYDIVKSGDWTMEYFNQLVKDAYTDDGNQVRDEKDTFGLVGNHTYADAFWTSCDISIIENNGTDRPTLNYDIAKIDGVVDKVYELFYENIGAEIVSDKDGLSIIQDPVAHFANDRAMFIMLNLGNLSKLSDMETMYGVLPMPKYDKAQENYRTYVQQSMSLWGIPTDVADKDMSSAVLTSLGYDSRETVVEVHYEKVLKLRYVKDSTSGYMIDLIYNSIFMNFDSIFNESLAQDVSKQYRLNMPVYVLRNMESELQSGKTNIQAWWDGNQSGLESRLNSILDGFFGTVAE